jgi:hypothetical protein
VRVGETHGAPPACRRRADELGVRQKGLAVAKRVGVLRQVSARGLVRSRVRLAQGESKGWNVARVRQPDASLAAVRGGRGAEMACNPDRDRAPNTRMKLTGALALPYQGERRE